MDSIRSCDILNQDSESFYKLIVENKNDHQSWQVKEESNQTITQIFSTGKVTDQNHSIFYCIFTKESWNNYNALFSQESLALSQLSHTDLDKIDQHLASFQPLLSLLFLHNPCQMKSIFFRKFSLPKIRNTHGKSYGCFTACGYPTNNTTDN